MRHFIGLAIWILSTAFHPSRRILAPRDSAIYDFILQLFGRPRRYLLTNGASYNSIADFFTDKPVKPIAASTGTASMESQAAANLYMRNQNKPVLKGQTTTGSNGPAPSGAGGVKPAKPSTSERP
jgi:hypothetical protein